MKNKKKIYTSALILGAALISDVAFAACPAGFPNHNQLRTALINAVNTVSGNGGFGLNMWATIVTRGGVVCDVVYSGALAPAGLGAGNQWPGSRVISAQKANTANAFSLPGLALSTANLYTATQPGGSLFGLQESNPVNPAVAYAGSFSSFGTADDPLIGQRIGGVNVFGGGLALYNSNANPARALIGGIGVSGDSSCADHNIAWRVRAALGLDKVPSGISPAHSDDNIVYDIAHGDTPDPITDVPVLGKSTSGWGHPTCSATLIEKTIANGFPKAGSTTAPTP
jgi:uncharacterized protein GlcG (DUF336 family)